MQNNKQTWMPRNAFTFTCTSCKQFLLNQPGCACLKFTQFYHGRYAVYYPAIMHKTFFEAMNHVEHLLSPWIGAGIRFASYAHRELAIHICAWLFFVAKSAWRFSGPSPHIKAKPVPNKADHWPKRSDTSIILSYIFWKSRFFESATEPQLATVPTHQRLSINIYYMEDWNIIILLKWR